jgi:hypothetical protein
MPVERSEQGPDSVIGYACGRKVRVHVGNRCGMSGDVVQFAPFLVQSEPPLAPFDIVIR